MLRLLSFPLIILLIALGVTEIIPVIKWSIGHYIIYKWVGVGMAAYFVLSIIRILTKNYGSRSKKGEFLRFELSYNALNRKPQK